MTSTLPGAVPDSRRTVSRNTGLLMAAEAAAFTLASAAHFAAAFTDAAIPELVIAALLALGSTAVLARRPCARAIAIATATAATLGTALGLTIIAAGPRDIPDLSYHASALTALAITLIVLSRGSGPASK